MRSFGSSFESPARAGSSKPFHASGSARNCVVLFLRQTPGRRQHFISFNSRSAQAGAVELVRWKENPWRRIYWCVSPKFRLGLVFSCAFQELRRRGLRTKILSELSVWGNLAVSHWQPGLFVARP